MNQVVLGEEVETWCKTTATMEDPNPPFCERGPCDDPEVRNAAIPDESTVSMTVRVKLNILSQFASDTNVADEIAQIQSHYGPYGIDFDVWPVRLEQSPYYNTTVRSKSEAIPIKEAHADSPGTKLNVYIVDIDFGGPVPVYGWAIFPWEDDALGTQGGIVIGAGAIGTGPGKMERVLTHEIGHALGLWHTYHGSDEAELRETSICGSQPLGCECHCYEPADRTPEEGDVVGDLCSDTPATPAGPYDCDEPYWDDPCTWVPWPGNVDRNHMAHKTLDRTCPDRFTAQQAGRMHCWTCNSLAGWIVSDEGGCCYPDGTCVQDCQVCCVNSGGTFRGASTTCGAASGACCMDDGSCTVQAEGCCVDTGGTFAGAETTCSGQVAACCLQPWGDCVDTVPNCCTARGGVTMGPGTSCDDPRFRCFSQQGPQP